MSLRPAYVAAVEGGYALKLWVQPGARKNELVGVHDGRLKIRLSAPAVENKANKALTRYLAELLGVKSRDVTIASGDTNRRKTLHVNLSSEPAWETLFPTGT